MAKMRIRNIEQSSRSRGRLKEILRAFKEKKILVIGDVGVDRYTLGTVDRISPEAPVPIVHVQEEKHKLGLAANVADNVQALGGSPLLCGIVGKDRGAEDFRKLLKEAKIDSEHLVVDSSRRTILKERIVSENQQLLRVDYESLGAMGARAEAALIKMIKTQIAECDAVILEDYAKGMITQRVAQAIFQTAKKLRKVVAVDPNSKTVLEMYQGATFLTPNTREAEALSGIKITDPKSLGEAGRVLLRKTRARNVVITRGKDGMAVFTAGKAVVQVIPTYAREVYDVSGAGDTVIAVMALAASVGAKIEDAAVLGNLAAGVEVGKRGTATVSPDEIHMAMDFFEALGV
jgi:rfaE bifunctional protein kinase chain/domain